MDEMIAIAALMSIALSITPGLWVIGLALAALVMLLICFREGGDE